MGILAVLYSSQLTFNATLGSVGGHGVQFGPGASVETDSPWGTSVKKGANVHISISRSLVSS